MSSAIPVRRNGHTGAFTDSIYLLVITHNHYLLGYMLLTRWIYGCIYVLMTPEQHAVSTQLVRLSLLHLPIPKDSKVTEHDLRRAAAARYSARILAATDHIGRGKRLA